MTSMEQISGEIKLAETLIQQLHQSFQTLESQFPPAVSLSHQWRNLQTSFDKIQHSLKHRAEELESKEKQLNFVRKSIDNREKSLEFRQKQLDSDGKLVCDRCGTLASYTGNVTVKIEPSKESDEEDDDGRREKANIRFSVTMDGKTLQIFLNDRVNEHELIGEDIYNALKLSSDPAKLVLDAMVGFFPPHLRKGNLEYETSVVRSSCVLLLEQLLTMKAVIKNAVKKEARNLAGEWREKMKEEGESYLLVLGFLLFVVVFKVFSADEKDEHRRLCGMVNQHRLAGQLRFRLGLLRKRKASSMMPQVQKEEPSTEENEGAIISPSTDSSVELCSLCKNTDVNGLRLYLIEHLKEQKSFHGDLSNCLRCAQDPAKLVFDVMQEFLLEMDGTQDDSIKSRCDFVIEQLMKLPTDVAPSVKEEAVNFAHLWRGRLTEGSKPSQAFAFLKFLASYGLASSFEANKLLFPFGILYSGDDIYELEQNRSLCRALGLEAKIPDLIESLIEEDERLVAVRYICAFNHADKFPPVPLLVEHLEYVKQKALKTCRNFKNSVKAQNKCATSQILALQAVIKCIMDFKLESQFSPTGLQQCIKQVEKQREHINSLKTDKKGRVAQKNRPALNPTFNFQSESNVSMKRAICSTTQNPEKHPRVGDVQNVMGPTPTVFVATPSNMNCSNQPSQGLALQCVNTTQVIPNGSFPNPNGQIQHLGIHGTGYGSAPNLRSGQSGEAAMPPGSITLTVNPTSLDSSSPGPPRGPDCIGEPESSVRYGLQYLYPPPS